MKDYREFYDKAWEVVNVYSNQYAKYKVSNIMTHGMLATELPVDMRVRKYAEMEETKFLMNSTLIYVCACIARKEYFLKLRYSDEYAAIIEYYKNLTEEEHSAAVAILAYLVLKHVSGELDSGDFDYRLRNGEVVSDIAVEFTYLDLLLKGDIAEMEEDFTSVITRAISVYCAVSLRAPHYCFKYRGYNVADVDVCNQAIIKVFNAALSISKHVVALAKSLGVKYADSWELYEIHEFRYAHDELPDIYYQLVDENKDTIDKYVHLCN